MSYYTNSYVSIKRESAIVKKIAMVHVGIYFLWVMLKALEALFVNETIYSGTQNFFRLNTNMVADRPWTLLTYIFVVDYRSAIDVVMFYLAMRFIICDIAFPNLKKKHFLITYFLGPFVASLALVVYQRLLPIFQNQKITVESMWTACNVVLIASTAYAPKQKLSFFSPRIKIEQQYIAIIPLVMTLISLGESEGVHSAGVCFVNLTSIIFGGLYGSILKWHHEKRKKQLLSFFRQKREGNKTEGGKEQADNVDAIYEKISQTGYSSLTDEERKKLLTDNSEEDGNQS